MRDRNNTKQEDREVTVAWFADGPTRERCRPLETLIRSPLLQSRDTAMRVARLVVCIAICVVGQPGAAAASLESADTRSLVIWVVVAVTVAALISTAFAWVALHRIRKKSAAANAENDRLKEDLHRLSVKLEARAKHRNEEEMSANHELAAFISAVSHDLRAPLRAIKGFSRVLSSSYAESLDDQGQHYIDRICAGTETMERLLDDLVRLSRVSHAELKPTRVDLSKIVHSIADELMQQTPERQVELKIEPGVIVVGDARYLQTAIENLVGNAFKYTRRQDRAQIEFGKTEQEGLRVFVIRDNGVGFDMTYADKLFKPFQRLHNAGEFEGNGIGLASVDRIIRRHQGRVWAHSAVDQGASFYFTLGEIGESRYEPVGDAT